MKILISSCLLGENVRYDGTHNKIDSKLFESILNKHTIYSLCPEVEGGLNTPRNPAEIINDNVITTHNINVTNEFNLGALKALEVCKKENIRVALLKAKSPSCGNHLIYDGSFSNRLIDGMGITTQLLKKNGIEVFNENELEKLLEYLHKGIC